ncbi:MAG: hypothetical protein LBC47_05365 [Tannerella sp.]|nr:hypothetical protein [Tannerella sp.]
MQSVCYPNYRFIKLDLTDKAGLEKHSLCTVYFNYVCYSKTDIRHIDNALELYGNLSWDEIREKSHDYAWRSTIINRQIKFEDILWEAGSDDELVEYVQEQNLLINLCEQC